MERHTPGEWLRRVKCRERHLHPDFVRVIGERGLRLGKGSFWRWGANKTVDVALFAQEDPQLVQLIRREDNGLLALPGGFIDRAGDGWESPLQAALRETQEEINVTLKPTQLLQFYDGPVRDHRETLFAWPHTTGFAGKIALATLTVASDDAATGSAGWYPLTQLSSGSMHGSHYNLVIAAQQALRDA